MSFPFKYILRIIGGDWINSEINFEDSLVESVFDVDCIHCDFHTALYFKKRVEKEIGKNIMIYSVDDKRPSFNPIDTEEKNTAHGKNYVRSVFSEYLPSSVIEKILSKTTT